MCTRFICSWFQWINRLRRRKLIRPSSSIMTKNTSGLHSQIAAYVVELLSTYQGIGAFCTWFVSHILSYYPPGSSYQLLRWVCCYSVIHLLEYLRGQIFVTFCQVSTRDYNKSSSVTFLPNGRSMVMSSCSLIRHSPNHSGVGLVNPSGMVSSFVPLIL